MAYVYRHIRLDKNQPFYIGISRGQSCNYKRGNSSCGRNVIWKRIASKTHYEVEILMDDITWQKAKEKEIEFIKIYGRLNNYTGILANMTDGGEGGLGIVVSQETRKKLSESSKSRPIKKETREKMAAKLRGRPQPEWQRKILSEAAKGKDVYWCKKKIDQYDLNGNFIQTFQSISEASKNLKINNIYKCLIGKRVHCGGFVFVYHGEKFKKLDKKPFLRKPVVDLTTGKIYDTIKDAAIKNKLNYHSLKSSLKAKKPRLNFRYV